MRVVTIGRGYFKKSNKLHLAKLLKCKLLSNFYAIKVYKCVLEVQISKRKSPR